MCQMKLKSSRIQSTRQNCFLSTNIIYKGEEGKGRKEGGGGRESRQSSKDRNIDFNVQIIKVLRFNELMRKFGRVNNSLAFKITELSWASKSPYVFAYINRNVNRDIVTWDLLHSHSPYY